MVYNGFYYSLKAARAIDVIHYYTTKEDVSRFHGVRMAVSNCRLVLGFAAILSHMTSTFLLATQDNVEFMMKFCEDIVLGQTFFEYLLFRFGVQKFIKLINLMKSSFSTVDAKIVQDCKKEEKNWFITFSILTLFGK